jgi:hypothetical protein
MPAGWGLSKRVAGPWPHNLTSRNFKVYEKTMKKNSKNMPYGINYKRIKKDLAFVSS